MVDASREAELRRAIEDLYFGYRAFTALPDRILAERGLGRTHHRILYFARRDPGISIGELLGVLSITKQAAHRPMKDLQQQGLIDVDPDPNDKRIRRLLVTSEGAALEALLSEAQMRLLEAAFSGAGAEAERHWRRVMSGLRSATGERSRATGE